MSDSDVVICQAFHQILATPPAKLEKKLSSQTYLAIATYLTQLPPQDHLDATAMAKHIGEYCHRPGNEVLDEWFLDIYNSLGADDIQKQVKNTKDPGDEADAPTEISRMLSNEGRDICQSLQNLATELLNQSNQGNPTQVQGQGKQSNQNAPN